MFRSVESDHNMIEPFLRQGENLLVTSIFRTCSTIQAYAASLIHGDTFALIGLTNERIIVLPLSNITGQPITKGILHAPKENASIQGSCLSVNDPLTERIWKYWVPLGFNRLSGQEAERFRDFFSGGQG